ncbi:3-hydroxyacyl-CoA dehydrogenase [Fodinicurvata sp. EGI_FJ10296]|uniref:3-hydroxyacyl-CoA dehydrogenase n=1 Tax=Fodinicurvata sp. EGI_FJ10296 TaxID=3231908 RepID=UPI003452D2D3
MEPSQTVFGVIGAGTMGRGIVQWAAQSGMTVRLHDSGPGAVEAALKSIHAMWDRMVSKDRMTAADADAAKARLTVVEGLEGFAGCDIVVEAIVERIDAKQSLFAALEPIVGPECLITTNTSSLSVTAIAAGLERPERVAGLHFFNPVPLMRLVEVVNATRTEDGAAERLSALVTATGHHPVICRDSPGFIVNHAGRAYYTEGLRLLQEGIAEAADIDRILNETAGFPMGPFTLMDLTGLDVSGVVMQTIYDQFFHDPRLRPTPLVPLRISAGLHGRKTGEGFYRYDDGKRVDVPEAPPRPGSRHAVWIDPRDAGGDRVGALLSEVGLTVEGGERPGADATIVVAPLGADTTTTALERGFDPARTIAVDTLLPQAFAEGGRLTLMISPAGDSDRVDGLHHALHAAGRRATVIRDSAGFVVQRVVAAVVNLGSDIAQQRVGAPQDIDTAVRLGLGYPAGPLSLGDRIGPAKVVSILDAMENFYGDGRYRVSPWLRRRAALGLSLLTDD